MADSIPTMATQSIELRPIEALIPYQGNARTHSRAQIKQIAASITAFGFVNPILVDAQDQVIAGHGRLAAAKHLGFTEVPVLPVTHLSAAEKRAYILADNRLAEKAGWDRDILAIELQALIEFDFEVELTGFAIAEIDVILDDARERGGGATGDGADEVPALPAGPAITKLGDLWQLGPHRLICGDARDANALGALLGNQPVDLIFTDPPYNVEIEGHVSGLGRVKHREFAMASGEMTEVEFIDFLTAALAPAAALCREGAIAFVCMDWRHMREMMAAGDRVFAELKNLCVWNKTNGGMGTFYRSKHELVFVWKVKPGPHVNSFGLGETGRYRTNVWDYAGVNTFGATRDADLAMHPTVKPVALIGDAIRDCTRRGDVVLDMFGGSGSTLIAADLAGRQARLVEYDPLYCDTIIRRWEKLSGKRAKHVANGLGLEELAEQQPGPAVKVERRPKTVAILKATSFPDCGELAARVASPKIDPVPVTEPLVGSARGPVRFVRILIFIKVEPSAPECEIVRSAPNLDDCLIEGRDEHISIRHHVPTRGQIAA